MNNITIQNNTKSYQNQIIASKQADPKTKKEFVRDLIYYIGAEFADLRTWQALCCTNKYWYNKFTKEVGPFWKMAKEATETLTSRFLYTQVRTNFLNFDQITIEMKQIIQSKGLSPEELLNDPIFFGRLELEVGPAENAPTSVEMNQAAQIAGNWYKILTSLDEDPAEMQYLIDGSFTKRLANYLKEENIQGTMSSLLDLPLTDLLFSEDEKIGIFAEHLEILCQKKGKDVRSFWVFVGMDLGIDGVEDKLNASDKELDLFFQNELKPKLDQVEYIRFSFESFKLAFLPENLGILKALQELSLENNLICELPSSIGRLSSLKSLFLGSNLIRKLPEAITDLSSLEELDLSNNFICELPNGMTNLTSLSDLWLNNNLFCQSPREIGDNTTVYIANNPIGQISSDRVDLAWMKAAEITHIWKEILTFLAASDPNLNIDQKDLNYLVDGSLAGRLAQYFRQEEVDLSKVTASSLLENLPLGDLLFAQDEDPGLFSNHLNLLQMKQLVDVRGFWFNVGSMFWEMDEVAWVAEEIMGLSDEEFAQLVEGLAPRLPEIQNLNLASRGIVFLPSNLEGFTSLEEVNLSGNPIFELSELVLPTSLKVLCLSGTPLRETPKRVAHLVSKGEEMNVGPIYQTNGRYFPLLAVWHPQTHPSITEVTDEEASSISMEVADDESRGTKRQLPSDESSIEEPPHKKRKFGS